jgi:hypothetical protein
MTPELKAKLAEVLDLKEELTDKRWRTMAAAALDTGMMDGDEYRRLSGSPLLPKVKIPYVNWWITGDHDGMITFAWVCFRHNGVTREQVADKMREDMAGMLRVTREIETLTAPKSGN